MHLIKGTTDEISHYAALGKGLCDHRTRTKRIHNMGRDKEMLTRQNFQEFGRLQQRDL